MKKLFQKLYGYIKELGHLTPLGFVTAFLPMVGSTILIVGAYPLGNWMRENWEIGTILFFLGVVFFCGLALLPTNVVGMVGGWSFGFVLGSSVLILAVVGAATMSFLIHLRIAGQILPEVFEKRPKAKAIHEALTGQNIWRTTLIISLVRLSVAFPFALTNFVLASARVPLKAFVVGTFVGMLPRSIAVAYVGAGLSQLTVKNPPNVWLIIFGLVATIISVIVISIISKNALNRLVREESSA